MTEDRHQASGVRRKKRESKIKVTNRDPKRLVKDQDEDIMENDPAPSAQCPTPDDSGVDAKTDPKEIVQLKEQLLRITADFDNFKRRTTEERSEMIDAARADLALQFIPVIDNFDRAAKHVPEDVAKTDWYKGFEGIQKQFDQVLEALGIARIESVGQLFDPNKHEAVSHEPSDDHDKDTISEEFEAGYTLGDSVIRPAKVNVSSGKEKE